MAHSLHLKGRTKNCSTMKHSAIISFVAVALVCTSCFPTRIVTVSPGNGNRGTYSTTVRMTGNQAVTTSARVTAMDSDISLYLDLQAVGAAFAQASTVEEFERLLNDSSYMLSDLDLNNDGYVDYLRVLETVEGINHVFLIQAVLGNNIYQDVATVVAELPRTGTHYVQVIGSSYIYGPNYIIQPVYYTTPLIITHLIRPDYRPWRSPWYWNHFPPHYRHPAPIHIGHYRAYVNVYMHNHKYCHEFHYAPSCHFPDYERMARPNMRNDFGVQHPERSFTQRTADIPMRSANAVSDRPMNARDIREMNDAAVQRTAQTTTSSARAAQPSSRTSGTASPTPSGTSRRQTEIPEQSTARTAPAARTQEPARTAPDTGTRETARTAPSTGAAERAQTSRQPSGNTRTTVSSRVSNSGSSRTNIKTESPSGQTSTVRRGSTTSTRSSETPARSTTQSSSNSRTTSGGTARTGSGTGRR